MIDIRPSYWTLPFIKWSQCARNSGQYSLAKPFRGIALAMANSLRLLIRGERFAKLWRPYYREDVAHLMDDERTAGCVKPSAAVA
jgi:hypothetical protein